MADEPVLHVMRARLDDLDTVLALLEDARRWLMYKGFGAQWPHAHPGGVFAERIDRGEQYIARYKEPIVGVFSLMWSDAEVWGYVPDDAGYVHALAVRRAEAGQ